MAVLRNLNLWHLNSFYSHSKSETIINVNDIDDAVFKWIYTSIISKIKNL